MTKQLHAASGSALIPALREALSGAGSAVFAGEPAPDLPERVSQRIAVVVQSSGSTGRPKRVALSADALLASAAASESALGGAGQWMLALPTTYIAGINVLVRSLVAGTDPVVMPPGHFDVEGFVAATRQLDAPLRFTSLVPAQLARLIDSAEALAELRRYDRILVGGQATPVPLLTAALELGLNISRSYGSSETSGGCVYDGLPIGQAEIEILDGEVVVTGPMLAEGYLDDPERTEAAFVVLDGRRGYRTGDAGAVTDGVLTVSGRLDDVIISGGVNVSLGAVEARVREWPGLADAVVLGAADGTWGEVPVVVATIRVDLAELRAFVTETLGAAAAPSRIVVVDGIPRLPSGKPDRLGLRSVADR